MSKDQALRLALDALNDRTSLMKWQKAREAVEQALEQPKPEPVAWMNPYGGVIHRRMTGHEKKHYTIPLYTSTPKREPLTDKEIKDAVLNHPIFGFALMSMVRDDVQVQTVRQAINGIARSIEAVIWEKNK